jgi:hypothetical protein
MTEEQSKCFTVCLTMIIEAKDGMQAAEIALDYAEKEPWRLSVRVTEAEAAHSHPIVITEHYRGCRKEIDAMIQGTPTVDIPQQVWEMLSTTMFQGFSDHDCEVVSRAFNKYLCTPEQQAVLDAADVTIADLLDDFTMDVLPEPERSAIVADWNKKLGLRYWEISHDDN